LFWSNISIKPPGEVLQKCTSPGLFPSMEFGVKQGGLGCCGLFRNMDIRGWPAAVKGSCNVEMKFFRLLARLGEE